MGSDPGAHSRTKTQKYDFLSENPKKFMISCSLNPQNAEILKVLQIKKLIISCQNHPKWYQDELGACFETHKWIISLWQWHIPGHKAKLRLGQSGFVSLCKLLQKHGFSDIFARFRDFFFFLKNSTPPRLFGIRSGHAMAIAEKYSSYSQN